VPSTVLTDGLIHRFRSVSTARVDRVEGGWAALRDGQDDVSPLDVRRDLHTLKGDSHLIGFSAVTQICHRLEELFAFAQGRAFDVSDALDLMMTMGLRFVAMLLLTKPGTPHVGIDIDGFLEQLVRVLEDERTAPPIATRRAPTRATVASDDVLHEPSRNALASAATSVFLEQLAATGVSRLRLRRAWTALRGVVSGASAVALGPRIALHLAPRIETAAAMTGKLVRVAVDGSDGHVSPAVAAAVDTAMVHLLRNAIVHGVENEKARHQAGKPVPAVIRVAVTELDDAAEIRIADDGRGIDWERVRRIAIDRGLLASTSVTTEASLAELLFVPEFSTAREVSELAGRGVGLDAVREAIRAVGGSVRLQSRPGAGTTATVLVPRAAKRLGVLRFACPRSPCGFVVSAEWKHGFAEPPASMAALDLVDVLRLTAVETVGATRALQLRRDGLERWILTLGEVASADAERICPTSPSDPGEIVLVNGEELVLIRPELFAAATGRGVS
jgi:two-component system chemotaxis sensor kinase CheA